MLRENMICIFMCLLLTIVVFLTKCIQYSDGYRYMDSMMSPSRPRQLLNIFQSGEDSCDPVFWYPKRVPEYCYEEYVRGPLQYQHIPQLYPAPPPMVNNYPFGLPQPQRSWQHQLPPPPLLSIPLQQQQPVPRLNFPPELPQQQSYYLPLPPPLPPLPPPPSPQQLQQPRPELPRIPQPPQSPPYQSQSRLPEPPPPPPPQPQLQLLMPPQTQLPISLPEPPIMSPRLPQISPPSSQLMPPPFPKLPLPPPKQQNLNPILPIAFPVVSNLMTPSPGFLYIQFYYPLPTNSPIGKGVMGNKP